MAPPAPAPPAQRLSPAAVVVDAVLEATVVGSFSRIGPAVRRRTAHWGDPPAAAGRVIVVTGATSGLGLAAATELGRLGARLCLVGRSPERAEAARRQVEGAGAPGVVTELADLGDLQQVADLADRIGDRLGHLDVLVHNAGALLHRWQASPQGVEATVAIHLLAPFVLTERLLPRLVGAAPSRVITVTSGGMYTQRFDLDHLESTPDGYDGTVAYARAKRAQVVLTHEWQRRHGHRGVGFHAVHPGWADTPGLTAGLPGFARRLGPLLRTPSEGADTMVWLSGGPDREPAGGRLWLDRRPRGEYRLPGTWVPAARAATDGSALWAWCLDRAGGRVATA